MVQFIEKLWLRCEVGQCGEEENATRAISSPYTGNVTAQWKPTQTHGMNDDNS